MRRGEGIPSRQFLIRIFQFLPIVNQCIAASSSMNTEIESHVPFSLDSGEERGNDGFQYVGGFRKQCDRRLFVHQRLHDSHCLSRQRITSRTRDGSLKPPNAPFSTLWPALQILGQARLCWYEGPQPSRPMRMGGEGRGRDDVERAVRDTKTVNRPNGDLSTPSTLLTQRDR